MFSLHNVVARLYLLSIIQNEFTTDTRPYPFCIKLTFHFVSIYNLHRSLEASLMLS